ncbi:hypothetical protein [Ottowia sp.]|uniref:hypothetical protein n=1 Tax=Ottowia sp. TaxID=1898956 RepID=UPI0039E46697
MRLVLPSRLLRLALGADALVGAVIAALHLLAGRLLADLLALPHTLLWSTGLFLVAWAALLFGLARAPRLAAGLAALVIDGNLLWALAAAGLLASGALATSAWGNAYLALNAVTVLALAALEWVGLRRSPEASGARVARA